IHLLLVKIRCELFVCVAHDVPLEDRRAACVSRSWLTVAPNVCRPPGLMANITLTPEGSRLCTCTTWQSLTGRTPRERISESGSSVVDTRRGQRGGRRAFRLAGR